MLFILIRYVGCILIMFLIIGINAANIPNCLPKDIHLTKIIGLRPSNAFYPHLLHKAINFTLPPPAVTAECIAKCLANPKCSGFLLFYDRAECYWNRNETTNTTHVPDEAENVLVDDNSAWFKKVCLRNIDIKCTRQWIFEQIPGAVLITKNQKSLPQAMTRNECLQKCVDETDFQCRSANFKVPKNIEFIENQNETTRGQCLLSNTDRHLLPNSYRASSYDEEYFENQCSDFSHNSNKNSTNLSEFCSYEEYDNLILGHTDMIFEHKSKEECHRLCDESTTFNCRSYSIMVDNEKCLLHSEDSKVHGPKLLKTYENTAYYEKARCLNISVSCSETYITIQYHPELDFHGKIYMRGYSENPQCYAAGDGYDLVTLKLPLLSSQCGIIKADSVYNRTLMSGTMVLQYNEFIQTQADRIIRVGCIFGNETRVLVGTGLTITSSLPNKGSTLVNITSNQTASPRVEMRIVDLSNQEETTDTQIGQELELVIELKIEKNGILDIWANHLIALTEKGDESIFLLDDRGCPTNLNIFPALTKVKTENATQLIARFQAFKFASSPIVRFSVIVEFCPHECPPIDCGNNIQSFGRRKRSPSSNLIQTASGPQIVPNTKEKHDADLTIPSTIVNQMPLEYFMVVRDRNTRSDRLVIGDNKILVAGYDYSTNEVCLDYSLLIGLMVTWIIVQIIIIICGIGLVRRYKRYYQHEYMKQSMEELHKNFGIGFSNLENRRVHWADNREHIM